MFYTLQRHPNDFQEGPERVKWELRVAYFLSGKIGLCLLALSKKNNRKWERVRFEQDSHCISVTTEIRFMYQDNKMYSKFGLQNKNRIPLGQGFRTTSPSINTY